MAKDDADCLALIRRCFVDLPAAPERPQGSCAGQAAPKGCTSCCRPIIACPTTWRRCSRASSMPTTTWNSSPSMRPEMLCANARLAGRPVAVIANRRGFLKTPGGPRIGGIVYTESARKVAYFVENAERRGTPLLYMQDVSGFMVGLEAEREGIIRAGAEMVETMACATVPKIVLTINHASGAGYYAMAGQGFDPNFTFSWPTARIGVMEGDSAVKAILRRRSWRNCRRQGTRSLTSCSSASRRPARITSAGWMRSTPRRAGMCDADDRSAGPRGDACVRTGGRTFVRIRHLSRKDVVSPDAIVSSNMIRIANGQGFWGDWLEAPVRLVEGAASTTSMLDYLAEVTMSILQKQKQADPNLGYARDFPPLIGANREANS